MILNNEDVKRVEKEAKAIYDVGVQYCKHCGGFRVGIIEIKSVHKELSGNFDTIEFCAPFMTPFSAIIERIMGKIKEYHIDNDFVIRLSSWVYIPNEEE